MSWFPIIYISSDDSSEEEISYYSDSEELFAGWSGNFPPSAATATSSSIKPNKKISADPAPSLEFYSSSSSDNDNDPTFDLSKELPKALTTVLTTAINNMKWPAVDKPTQAPRPPKQVLGLACPRKQLSFDDKRKKISKGKHQYEGKGKKPME
jgi:hypothetical protein